MQDELAPLLQQHLPGIPVSQVRTYPSPRDLGGASTHYRVAYRDRDGRLIEHQTEDPTRLLAELTAEALARGERLQELSVGRPTLEDVYLELTGGEIDEEVG